MNKANDVKLINLSAILRSVYINKSITKSRISSELGITFATVSNLISELCNIGICEEDGFVSNGGRNATLYRINKNYGYIISLDLTRSGLVSYIHDISLSFVDKEYLACDITDVIDSVNKMKKLLLTQIEKLSGKRILGIGVSVPGRVSDTGVIISIPDYPQWNSVQLKNILSESISLPIHIDNDTNALLLSSKWNGIAEASGSVVYLNTDDGMGAGFMINDTVFKGSNNQSCEVGHITIDPDGPICNCGNRGCLQAYISNNEILGQINAMSNSSVSTIDEAIDLYRNGDKAVQSAFLRATTYISLAIRNVIMVFDPELIIIQNKLFKHIPDLFNHIENTVFKAKTDRLGLPIRNKLNVLLNSDSHIIETASASIVLHDFMWSFMI